MNSVTAQFNHDLLNEGMDSVKAQIDHHLLHGEM
jgi:hypothetical protein